MEYPNVRKRLHVLIVFLFVFCLSALLGCGSGNDFDLSSGWSMPDNSVTIGAAGGEASVKDSSSPIYGAKVVVPAGALTQNRSFEMDEKFFRYPLPDGFIPYPSKDGCFELIVSGEKPYGLNLTISFPVKGMTVAANEKPSAIVYDSRVSKWIILTPDYIDANTMTVATTYRDYWMWGKMNLDKIDTDYLIGAVKERYGEAMWYSAIDSIATAINTLNTLRVDRTCQTWTTLRDTTLPNLITNEKTILLDYQSKLGSSCGTCDLFSTQFGFELSKYLLARTVIISADIWDLLTSGRAGYLPVLGDIDLLIDLERFIALCFIESQQCQYSCVTQKLGLPVYAHYTIHYTYLIAELFAVILLDDGWIPCPTASLNGPMNSLLAYRQPAVYQTGQFHPFANSVAGWSVANDSIRPDLMIDKHMMSKAIQQQLARHLQNSCNSRSVVN